TRVLKQANLKYELFSLGLEKIYRTGKLKDYEILINHSNKTKWHKFKKIPPYSFQIIPKDKT
ncbi:MAG: hypothetical protein N3A69_18370, partial [Leptospiraceae bacterium]|nr:hypothetical protein [Leptospiraceae bacterium]